MTVAIWIELGEVVRWLVVQYPLGQVPRPHTMKFCILRVHSMGQPVIYAHTEHYKHARATTEGSALRTMTNTIRCGVSAILTPFYLLI